ncbi:SDR family oxidoreductase [Thiohalorhabdus sp.]|uniref:SDR family oxidoreductase n=1 Tax=Thiohalorhabdus sp. TaxID=3094134 RepID=UPI002FC2A2DA
MAEPDLTGRVILITGASRGIGFATARRALEAGARVVLGSKTTERLAAAAEELAPYGELIHRAVDVAHYDAVEAFVSLALERFGRIDVLVNNAGVAWAGDFADMPPAAIDAAVTVNVGGVLHGTRAALPTMREQGSGTVINISSGAGRTGIPGLAAYSATKSAVNGFTEALAGELEGSGMEVFAVCPGRVATDMQETVSGRRQGVPPERVAEAVLGLLGPRPPIRPGQCLEVIQ